MKVLMVGATGTYAHLVVPALKKRNVTVRALARDGGRAAIARQHGADETAIGDLRDPASLRAALDGVDGVFTLTPAFAPDESQMGIAMVQATKAMGVRKLVFQSAIHPSIAAMVNHRAKQPVEEAIFESGLDYTVLQPTMFMQNLDGAVVNANEQGVVATPYSKQSKMCYVDYRDVAEVIALALTSDRLSYGTFELCGPGMYSQTDIAALLGEILGRSVEAGEIPPTQWARSLPPGPLSEGLAKMMDHYDHYGLPGGNALVLRAILGRDPRTLREYFSERASHESHAFVGGKIDSSMKVHAAR
jgi:uncharacterized protein YbjT (DUF2867 family)